MTDEQVVYVHRAMSLDDAKQMIGAHVGTDLEPTVTSPRDGQHVRVLDADTQETVALITRLPRTDRAALRRIVTGHNYGENVGRHMKNGQRKMSQKGLSLGYVPPKPAIKQEGCRASQFARDFPGEQATMNRVAEQLSHEFETLLADQAAADKEVVQRSVHGDWRMGESNWTSGVINDKNLLPYHRDGNNLMTWSAMPTLRMGMSGGHLHLPEYDLVFPCGDGDVTWFFGRMVVHGVTDMHRRRADAYRYSIVFYALSRLKSCATYAEETAKAHRKRTMREREIADTIRAQAVLRVRQQQTCPECLAGKHRNCDGTGGWDDTADAALPCLCRECIDDEAVLDVELHH